MVLEGKPAIWRSYEERPSDATQLCAKARLCAAAAYMLDYCITECDVERTIVERQLLSRLDSEVSQARILAFEVRPILRPYTCNAVRIRIELLKIVRLLKGFIAGNTHIKHRYLWSGSEIIHENLEHLLPYMPGDPGCHRSSVLVVSRNLETAGHQIAYPALTASSRNILAVSSEYSVALCPPRSVFSECPASR